MKVFPQRYNLHCNGVNLHADVFFLISLYRVKNKQGIDWNTQNSKRVGSLRTGPFHIHVPYILLHLVKN